MNVNRYTVIKLLFAACAVLAGGAYMYLGQSALPVVLPVMCVCFTAIAVLAVREVRSKGGKGVIVIFTALAAGLVAFFSFVGMIAWFAGR